jgi:hypothetical protein
MEIPFVGPSYQMQARSFDAQRSINLYPILSESGTSKSVAALRGTAGLKLYTTSQGGQVRGCISSTSGRGFVVSGDKFEEVTRDGSTIVRGTINTQSSRVTFSESALEIMLVDGTDGWIFNKDTDAFTKITDADFPQPSYVTFQDGYFIVTKANSQQYFISGINNGLSWDALDFTSVESSPDDLVCAFSDNGNLWLMGNRSVEVYANTGAAAFPFERIGGAIIQTGCAAGFTVQKFNNSVIWLGIDEQGKGTVFQSNGYSVTKVSTQSIEWKISQAGDISDSYAWVYHERGHVFYMLQIRGLDTTLVLDGTTGLWHERSYKNPATNRMELHRGFCCMMFNNRLMVGDRIDGRIYEMSLDYYTDDGDEIIRERTSPHLQDEKRFVSYSSFELDMEQATALAVGQGSDPQVMLQYSDDGGNNWSNEVWRTFGKVGQYWQRPIWRQLGRGRDRVFRVRVSDPVFVQLNAAYINAT